MKDLLHSLALIALIGLFAAVGAFAQTPNTATIEFQRPTAYPNGDPVPATLALSYNVFQAECPQLLPAVPPAQWGVCSTPIVGTKSGTITTTTGTITTGLLSGKNYCFQVTAFVTGQEATTESARSNWGCKAFTGMGTVTITVR